MAFRTFLYTVLLINMSTLFLSFNSVLVSTIEVGFLLSLVIVQITQTFFVSLEIVSVTKWYDGYHDEIWCDVL